MGWLIGTLVFLAGAGIGAFGMHRTDRRRREALHGEHGAAILATHLAYQERDEEREYARKLNARNAELRQENDMTRQQRDRLNRENATLAAHLAEVGEQLQTTILELHETRMERDNEASENRALKLRLGEMPPAQRLEVTAQKLNKTEWDDTPRRRRKGQPATTDIAE